jgi:CBS domain-containing protein
LVCLRLDDKVVDAFVRMFKQRVGRLPVQEDGSLVGVVTRSDILHTSKVKTELAT